MFLGNYTAHSRMYFTCPSVFTRGSQELQRKRSHLVLIRFKSPNNRSRSGLFIEINTRRFDYEDLVIGFTSKQTGWHRDDSQRYRELSQKIPTT